jgi:hypothetical protein
MWNERQEVDRGGIAGDRENRKREAENMKLMEREAGSRAIRKRVAKCRDKRYREAGGRG